MNKIRFEDLPVRTGRNSIRYSLRHKASGLYFGRVGYEYTLSNRPIAKTKSTMTMWLKRLEKPEDFEVVEVIAAMIADKSVIK